MLTDPIVINLKRDKAPERNALRERFAKIELLAIARNEADPVVPIAANAILVAAVAATRPAKYAAAVPIFSSHSPNVLAGRVID